MIINCPQIVIALIFSWIVLLDMAFVFFGIRYFIIKKYVISVTSIVFALLCAFTAQVMTAFIKGGTDALSTFFAELPLYVYIIVLALFTIITPLLSVYLYRYTRTHVSSNSIIRAFNASNEGFLYFDKDGACLLINKTMAKIASSLTKTYIMNGNDFLKRVKDQTITLEDGSTYKFIDREITISNSIPFVNKTDSQIINELIALDVTELVKKNELLKEDNEKLEQMNKELVSYNEKMLEVIRHKEILSAKINIHNEMNTLVLQSSYLVSNDNKEERKKLLSKWENNALLLCKEAENNNDDFISDLKTLADAIGITIECKDYSPIMSNEKITSLFVKATKESLLNVAKHTKNKKIIINIERVNGSVIMSFINDNNVNTKPIIKGGGFTNIEKSVEELNGKMTIINEGRFILRIEVKDAL